MELKFRIVLIIVLSSVLLLSPAKTAGAATQVVTNNLDSGPGSLRAAIAAAGSGDTITFDGDYTITLASQLEIIDKAVTITGAGHHITISGNNAVRVFHVGDYNTSKTGNLTIDHLNIVNGASKVEECAGSAVSCGGGLMLEYLATATVLNSTFSSNDGGFTGGAIYSYYGNPLTVTNSTFVNNHAMAYAGAIQTFYGSATLTNNTFTGNSASGFGGAILNNWGTVTFRNNIFANNSAPDGGNCNNNEGTFNDGGGNLVWGDTSYCPGVNANPRPGTLGNYGGDTPTLPLLPGSAAINAASANCPPSDQRGMARGTTCDSGAFESSGFSLGSQTGTPQSGIVNRAFANPPGLTVTANNALEPVGGGAVTFTAPATGASVIFSANPAPIAADGKVSPIVTANGATGGPYDVTAAAVGAPSSLTFSLTNLPELETNITAQPAYLTSNTSASFRFDGSGGAAPRTFECSLDSAGFSACTNPQQYDTLEEGSHTFQVRSVDSLNNKDTTPAAYTWVVNAIPLNAVVSSAAASPTRISPIPITITFSDPVTGFIPSTVAGDIILGGVGGVASNPSGSGKTYTFDLAPGGQGVVTVQVPSGSALDPLTNENNPASNTFNITYDSVSPTVTVNQAAGQSDPAGASPVNFSVVFSEPVTGFTNADVTLGGTANPAAAVVTQTAPHDGSSYNIAVSGMSADGTVTASLAAGKVKDLAGNDNTASTSTDDTVSFFLLGIPTTTTLTFSEHSSRGGQSWTLTAAVSANTGIPAGKVTFRDGAGVLGTSDLTAGAATFEVPHLAYGPHHLTAEYQRGESYAASVSEAVDISAKPFLFLPLILNAPVP